MLLLPGDSLLHLSAPADLYTWVHILLPRLQEFLKNLTLNDKQSRLSGSSLDAAFADYRWIQPPH